MINEKDIVFVTTTLYTKWLDYQSSIIKTLFPDSEHIIIDGRNNWPNSWFSWIETVKNSNKKYYIHIDEDFFITNKDELLMCLSKMEDENIDIMGCPDGYHHFRQHNPIAINTFLMIGKIEHLKDVDFRNIAFSYNVNGYINNMSLSYKEEYLSDFVFEHDKQHDCCFDEFEPYYAFMWKMKDMKLKFSYLYPFFDDRFKSTNPRLCKESNDIGIHMWYTRQWYSNMDVLGLSNINRYNKIEEYLIEKKLVENE